jgi:hypothetical protein
MSYSLIIMLTSSQDTLSSKSLSLWDPNHKDKMLISNSFNFKIIPNSALIKFKSESSPLLVIPWNHHALFWAMRKENNFVFLQEILSLLMKLEDLIWLLKEQLLFKNLLDSFMIQLKKLNLWMVLLEFIQDMDLDQHVENRLEQETFVI